MERTFKNHTPYLGKNILPTKKVKRYFNLARNVAFNSEYGKIRHGALLIKGGSIINTCCNKDKFCSFGTRFRDPDRGHATIHAELGCILGMPRSSMRVDCFASPQPLQKSADRNPPTVRKHV